MVLPAMAEPKVPQVIQVKGEVQVKKPQPWKKGMTLRQVVNRAKPTALADQSRVYLLRNGKRYVFDIQNKRGKPLKVYPGDTIELPKR